MYEFRTLPGTPPGTPPGTLPGTLPEEGSRGKVGERDGSSAFHWWVIVVGVVSLVLLLGLLALVFGLRRRRGLRKKYDIENTSAQNNLRGGKANYFEHEGQMVVRWIHQERKA